MAQYKDEPSAHVPGVRKGEEIQEDEGKEPGRYDTGTSGPKRPTGTSTARDMSSVDPREPIDPKAPTNG